MSVTQAELEESRAILRARLTSLEESYAQTRDKLKKADHRRATDPDPRRWNSVLDNLERGLDGIRARLQATQIQLETVEQNLARARAGQEALFVKTADLVDTTSDVDPESLRDAESGSLEAMAQVSAALEQAMGEPGGEDEQTRQLEARLEVANQAGGTVDGGGASGEDRRHQLALRTAIEKIQTNRISDMTPQELSMTIHCYNLLSRRLNPSLSDQRLARILGAAIKILQRKQAQLNRP